jgi:hypothetical protein
VRGIPVGDDVVGMAIAVVTDAGIVEDDLVEERATSIGHVKERGRPRVHSITL